MSGLKPLIEGQAIRIDSHHRDDRTDVLWDNPNKDIHIHKTTNIKYEGEYQSITIRIPINTNKAFSVENKKGTLADIPRKLKKEIRNTLENIESRQLFVDSLLPVLKNYKSILDDKSKVMTTMEKIAYTFGLPWNKDEVMLMYNSNNKKYRVDIKDEDLEVYQISMNRASISVKDIGYKSID